MKTTKFLQAFLFLSCLSFFNSYAQEPLKKETNTKFGVKAGVNFSNLYTDDVDDNNMLTGFHVGGYAKIGLSDTFAIQPEISYTTKGAELVYSNILFSGTGKFKLNYIEVPVLAVINVTENLSIQVGPYAAYLIDAKITNEASGNAFDFASNLDTDDYNRFDAGLVGGIDFDLGGFGFGARYNYGLTKVGKDAAFGSAFTFPDAKNSVISAYLSFGFN